MSYFSMAPLNTIFLVLAVSVFMCFSSLSNGREQAAGIRATPNFIRVNVNSLIPHHTPTCKHSFKGKRQGASLDVHKHGPCSKHHTSASNNMHASPSHSDLLLLDKQRVNSIHARLSGQSPAARDKAELQESKSINLPARSSLSIGTSNYIVSVGLGSPQKDLSLVFDTGSDITWTQCKPCEATCYSQVDPIFDPTSSSSYTNITCNSALCSDLVAPTGVEPTCMSSTCVYLIQYGDGSFSQGFFAKERLTLTSTEYIDGFVFGCGEDNQGLFQGSAGLIGLGRDQLSLVSQAAGKYGKYFSYCLPQNSSSTGHLTLGQGGTTASNFSYTPLLTSSQNPSFYFLDLQAISVAGIRLSISPSVFSSTGTIIDSGTVITRLPPRAYSALSAAFKKHMSHYPSAPAYSIFDTCFDFTNYMTVSVYVPRVTFYFGGGGVLDIPPTGLFYYGADWSQMCMAFAGNGKEGQVGILGNVQQQGFDVVYDVDGDRVGFGANAC